MNRNRFIFVLAITLIVVSIFAGGCSSGQTATSPAELLSLGERFLLEMNYEQALVQFLQVIEIEPMNARAYYGAARAYIGLGQIHNAVDILQRGIELTGDDGLRVFLDELLSESPEVFDDVQNIEIADTELAVPLWYLYTDEQRVLLTRLEVAVDQFDYRTVYEIMTSIAFLELFEEIETREVEDGFQAWGTLKTDVSWYWGLSFFQTRDGSYRSPHHSWRRRNPDDLSVSAMIHHFGAEYARVQIVHANMINNISNGIYESIVFERGLLIHSQGMAVDGLRHGTEMVTWSRPDQNISHRYILQYDQGIIQNYIINQWGEASIVSECGNALLSALPNVIMFAPGV